MVQFRKEKPVTYVNDTQYWTVSIRFSSNYYEAASPILHT